MKKKIEIFLMLLLILAAFYKSFAIGKIVAQEQLALFIFLLSTFYCSCNLSVLFSSKLCKRILLLGLTFFISNIFYYITSVSIINPLDFINSLMFPSIFLFSSIFFMKYPDLFVYMKFIGLLGVLFAFYNLFRFVGQIDIKGNLRQTNSGNNLIVFFPFIFAFKNKYIKLFLLFIVLLGCLYSLKRSVMVIFIFSMLAVLLYDKRKLLGTGMQQVVFIFIVASFSFIIYPKVISKSYSESMLERFQEAEETGGGGRTSLFFDALTYQSELPIEKWFIGTGFRGFSERMKLNGQSFSSTHNDFTEIMYDYGVVSLVVFISIIVSMLQIMRRSFKLKSPFFLDSTLCFICYFIASLLVCTHIHYWFYLVFYIYMAGIFVLSEKKNKLCKRK